MYQPKKIARSQFAPVRNLQYHLLVWGEPAPGKVPLVMLHGWMDVAASWQFMVDAFASDQHYVIAPDWRGYGLTASPHVDNYWFPDYFADLDILLDDFSPDSPVNLIGHSMGGNIAMLYSGIRPERIRRLVNLEGFGMAQTRPAGAAKRYVKWMEELKAFHRGEVVLKSYDSVEGVARRLMKTNRRLRQDKADWLATQWSSLDPHGDGTWHILGDPAHKIINAQQYRVDEALELYRHISAPTLAVVASDDSLSGWYDGKYTLAEYYERLKNVQDCRIERVEDAGHMVHHDQPEVLARLIEAFIE